MMEQCGIIPSPPVMPSPHWLAPKPYNQLSILSIGNGIFTTLNNPAISINPTGSDVMILFVFYPNPPWFRLHKVATANSLIQLI